MITGVPGLRTLPAAAVVAVVLSALLAGCGPAEQQTSSPDLPALRSSLQDSSSFADVRSVTADYWENDLGQGTLKVTLTVGEGGDAEAIADDAVGQIWTEWITDHVKTIDVVVLGTENVTYTVQRRYNLPGQTDELTEQYGDPAVALS